MSFEIDDIVEDGTGRRGTVVRLVSRIKVEVRYLDPNRVVQEVKVSPEDAERLNTENPGLADLSRNVMWKEGAGVAALLLRDNGYESARAFHYPSTDIMKIKNLTLVGGPRHESSRGKSFRAPVRVPSQTAV